MRSDRSAVQRLDVAQVTRERPNKRLLLSRVPGGSRAPPAVTTLAAQQNRRSVGSHLATGVRDDAVRTCHLCSRVFFAASADPGLARSASYQETGRLTCTPGTLRPG